MASMQTLLDREFEATPPVRGVDDPASASCRCGQDLEVWHRSHCPRCGTSLSAH